jgi:hypothetical protein
MSITSKPAVPDKIGNSTSMSPAFKMALLSAIYCSPQNRFMFDKQHGLLFTGGEIAAI